MQKILTIFKNIKEYLDKEDYYGLKEYINYEEEKIKKEKNKADKYMDELIKKLK